MKLNTKPVSSKTMQKHQKTKTMQKHQKTKTKQKQKQKNYSQISLMNTDVKILNRILANRSYQCIKRIKYHNHQAYSREEIWFNIKKSINVIYHTTV